MATLAALVTAMAPDDAALTTDHSPVPATALHAGLYGTRGRSEDRHARAVIRRGRNFRRQSDLCRDGQKNKDESKFFHRFE